MQRDFYVRRQGSYILLESYINQNVRPSLRLLLTQDEARKLVSLLELNNDDA